MNLTFTLPAPAPKAVASPLSFWGTYYYVYFATPPPDGTGIPLLNVQGTQVGPKISEKDWCLGACEGTIAFLSNGSTKTLNYQGQGSPQASCSRFFTGFSPSKTAAIERSRFTQARGPFGDGNGSYALVPFRSVAVDPSVVSIGTALFIPEAVGRELNLPDGSEATHDGYFFAADTGGAIEGNHLDFFLGITQDLPFPFATSNPSGLFQVEVVTDPDITAELKLRHLKF